MHKNFKHLVAEGSLIDPIKIQIYYPDIRDLITMSEFKKFICTY